MQFSHQYQLATSLLLRSQLLGRCIAGQWVARLHILGGTVSFNLPLIRRSRRGRGGRKLEINIPQQQMYTNSKEGLINKGGVM